MSSGAALSKGNISSFCNARSPLTIANDKCTTTTEKLGKTKIEKTAELLSSLTARFAPTNPEDYVTEINTGEIGKIYYSSGNLTINSNIIDNSTYNTLGSLKDSQTLIIANGNININPNVTRIDAWIVSGGTINTCDGYTTTNLTSEDCKNQLQIKGPVLARDIVLPRTYGADPFEPLQINHNSLYDPAERIDYNPISLLWAYFKSREASQPLTTYLRKLAPRY